MEVKSNKNVANYIIIFRLRVCVWEREREGERERERERYCNTPNMLHGNTGFSSTSVLKYKTNKVISNPICNLISGGCAFAISHLVIISQGR